MKNNPADMDEHRFRQTYHAVNPLPCPFEKAILTRRFGCRLLQKYNIAEREAIGCTRPGTQQRCTRYIGTLREAARFALGSSKASAARTHGKEIRIQCGGLQGLQTLLDAASATDIDTLLETACRQYGSVDALPLDRIMPGIAHYQLRKRAKRK